MTIAVTTIGTNTSASGATVAITVPAGGVPAGSLIILTVFENNNSGTVGGAVADTALNTYTVAVRKADATPKGFTGVFYAFNSAALVQNDTITYTKQTSGDTAAISACYATGVQTASDPLDSSATASANGTSTTPSVTSGVPAASGDLFIGAVGNSANTNPSFTQDSGNGWAAPPNEAKVTIAMIDGGNQVNAGVGTLTFAPTFGASVSWADVICAFKAPAAAFVPYMPWRQLGPTLAQ